MSAAFNENIRRTLELADQMLNLAELGDMNSEDATCSIMYGVMRDTAYKLRKLALEECEKHKKHGKWD